MIFRPSASMEITAWAEEHFQITLYVNKVHNAINRYKLKLCSAKKKPYVVMIIFSELKLI